MNPYRYSIYAGWKADQEAPDRIARKFLATLEALGQIDPAFEGWGVVDASRRALSPLAQVRQDLPILIEAGAVRDDYGDPAPGEGYRASAHIGRRNSPKSLTFSIKAGSRWENHACLEAGSFMVPAASSMVTYPLFKAALLAVVSIWGCSAGVARVQRLVGIPELNAEGATEISSTGFLIPWIAYLAPSLAQGLSPPAGAVMERTPDGGGLLSAAETTLDPADPVQVANARAIAQILKASHVPGL